MNEQELIKKIEEELSQYSSALLAWKSWGRDSADKVHNLKLESSLNIMKLIKEVGYTHQPESPQDKVEAVAEILNDCFRYQGGKDRRTEAIRRVLSLFPEYEPVELEALGDEEIQ